MTTIKCDYLDAGDLGLELGTEVYDNFVTEIGSEAPWAIDIVQTHFDRRYKGWDQLQPLQVSSPLSHLRGLEEVFGCHCASAAEEVFREMTRTLKHIVLRQMLRQQVPSDEANFLLLVLERTGSLWMAERHQRVEVERASKLQCAEAREEERGAAQDAIAAAKRESQLQLAEMAAELEAQQDRSERMQKEMEALRYVAENATGLESGYAALQREHDRAQRQHEEVSTELHVMKAKLATAVRDRDDQEGMVAELTRRVRQLERAPKGDEPSVLQLTCAAGAGPVEEAVAKRRMMYKRAAGAVVMMLGRWEVGQLQIIFWGWRRFFAQERHDAMKTRMAAMTNEAAGASRAFDLLACRALVNESRDTRPVERDVCLVSAAVQTEVHLPSKLRNCWVFLAVLFAVCAIALAAEPYM